MSVSTRHPSTPESCHCLRTNHQAFRWDLSKLFILYVFDFSPYSDLLVYRNGTYSVRLLITAVRNKYMIWFFVIWRNCPFKFFYYWPVCLADLLEATLVKLLQLLRRGRVTVRVVHWTGWTKLTSAHSCLVLLATTQFYFQDLSKKPQLSSSKKILFHFIIFFPIARKRVN